MLTDGMHQFMYNDAWVNTTTTKRDRLHISCSSNTTAATTALYDMNICTLICSWDKTICLLEIKIDNLNERYYGEFFQKFLIYSYYIDCVALYFVIFYYYFIDFILQYIFVGKL